MIQNIESAIDAGEEEDDDDECTTQAWDDFRGGLILMPS